MKKILITEDQLNNVINHTILTNHSLVAEQLYHHKNNLKFLRVRQFKTDEGNFSIYDTKPQDEVRDRACMFTVFEDPQGWIVRNAIVPEEQRRQGIATNFYIKMNKLSLQQTGNPLKSTQPRKLSTGEVVHELSPDGIKIWDSFVAKGLAKKLGHKNYIFI